MAYLEYTICSQFFKITTTIGIIISIMLIFHPPSHKHNCDGEASLIGTGKGAAKQELQGRSTSCNGVEQATAT